MKELSIEEKAKCYDESRERMKDFLKEWENCGALGEAMEKAKAVFPELKEWFEDEKIINRIKKAVEEYWSDEPLDEILAWLEKQYEQKPTDKVEPKFKVGDKIKLAKEPKYPAREIITIQDNAYYFDKVVRLPFSSQDEWELVEQKPAEWDDDAIAKLADEYEETLIKESNMSENMAHHCRLAFFHGADAMLKKTQCKQKLAWSEEDEDMCYKAIAVINRLCAEGKDYVWSIKTLKKLFYWLKFLKYKVQSQPRQEWSEEDEAALGDALWCCKQAASIAKDENDMGNVWYAEHWLKYIKERYTWKPSDAQMASITCAVRKMKESACYDSELVSLFNDLKKLRDE